MTQPFTIGGTSAEAIERLKATAAELESAGPSDVEPILKALLDRIDGTALRISIVGQVKAGKSSMINALTGLTDLLPTQVNPWTAVITNLHFGMPGKTHGGGVFRFFSKDEWARMLEGGSESRRLAEEFLPGFRSEVLERQIVEMQEKAKARLGDSYKALLGQSHRFQTVTAEVLERYVSAGHSGQGRGRATVGRFSGITKSADVYLEAGRFAVPTTVSDTPGINDPFLVRDEITTSSFRLADVFVATFSAHQVLNPADIALLRMLGRTGQRTTVVFVNRIDELDMPAESVPEVVQTLEARLATEVGGSGYEVVPGSAEWARIALTGTDAEVEAAAGTEDCVDYARTLGLGEGLAPRERLLRVSGLPALADAITRMGFEGKTTAVLAEAVSGAVSSIDFLRRALGERLQKETSAETARVELDQLARAEGERIDSRLADLRLLSQALLELTRASRTDMKDSAARITRSVMRSVKISMDVFIDQQVARFIESIRDSGPVRSWSLDTLEIQEKTRQNVLRSFEAGRRELDSLMRDIVVRINATLGPAIGHVGVDTVFKDLPHGSVLSTFQPKSSFVEVELTTSRGWKFWQSRQLSEGESIRRITELVRAELAPAVKVLEESVQTALEGRNAAVSHRIAEILMRAKELIDGETADLQRDVDLLEAEGGVAMQRRLLEERDRRAEALRSRIAALEEAAHRLIATVPGAALSGGAGAGRPAAGAVLETAR